MLIRDMFHDDINRRINGVIKVDQSDTDVISQEIREYVITRELKRHFLAFFSCYEDSFTTPTADIGVWISGFFGSGKSHFLKMLSYLLENREIDGVRTVEMFRDKFAEDPASFMLIEKATKYETETILFNIDVQAPSNKDSTAVLRIFAKMFYNHLGFYGSNIKIARLEKYIDQVGKTEEFRRVFEAKKGLPWTRQYKAFAFNRKIIVQTLMEVLDMTEEDARSWFKDKSDTELSVAQLAEDIKEYAASKPKNFRLLFMIDEVGQYVGEDTNLLLNLQSLVEKIGSECAGSVWVVCTGQEAINMLIKVRMDEFSRIQARFKTRLSLSSSSVDEVIQKRILRKKAEVLPRLEEVYEANAAVLSNLLSFRDCRLDIKGFSGPQEFAEDFPFIPYQFTLMQSVFSEIRRHGNAGQHFSGGERSMLSGFQEAAQKMQDRDEYALIPFHLFYDTVHSFLDTSIRSVVERCQRAAESHSGIEEYDVAMLKLLYLIRYVDDIKATQENILILMADSINTDKIALRGAVSKSLSRLLSQNFIGCVGDIYNFLTDEEQDIQREINDTPVDTASIVGRIAELIYGNIYTSKKFRYGRHDYPVDQMVDEVLYGAANGDMKLRFLSVACDAAEKGDLRLRASSAKQAVVVLDNTPYYDSVEKALKIRKYAKQRNISQLSKTAQEIVRARLEDADNYDQAAIEALRAAIEKAAFYVDGELVPAKGDAKGKIEQALEYLVEHIYSELDLITVHAEGDGDLEQILKRGVQQMADGTSANQEAAAKIAEYLEIQRRKNLSTSMADIQSRYQAVPYGWRELDIACVTAQLIHDQKVVIKYAGTAVRPDNPKLPGMLRRKSETGRTMISVRENVALSDMKEAREFLRDYFNIMDVPGDEDGMVEFIKEHFADRKEHYEALLARYAGRRYPGRELVQKAAGWMDNVLAQSKDNVALVTYLTQNEDDLYDCRDALQKVEDFFKSQVQVFDAAAQMLKDLENETEYFRSEQAAARALEDIRQFVVEQSTFDYPRIPDLNPLMAAVRTAHNRLLSAKRAELLAKAGQYRDEVHAAAAAAADADTAKSILEEADRSYELKKQRIEGLANLALLDGLVPPMLQEKDRFCRQLESLLRPDPDPDPDPKRRIVTVSRQSFPGGQLKTAADVDAYVEDLRSLLSRLMQSCDGIELL